MLAPFGSVPELLRSANPWTGHIDQDPIMTVVRVERIGKAAGCEKWKRALLDLPFGGRFDPAKPDWSEWAEWTKDDRANVRGCDDFPCDVKLDRAETEQMKAVPEEARQEKFVLLVKARVELALKSGHRREYEFAGDPQDPWQLLEKAGFRSKVRMPSRPELWIRKLNLAPGKMKPFRQILDRRAGVSAGEATVWIRDLYDAHYFDSWGEWMDVSCDVATDSVTLVQAVQVELDLLKKHDLFSKIGRPRMRSAVHDAGLIYLERSAENLKRLAK